MKHPSRRDRPQRRDALDTPGPSRSHRVAWLTAVGFAGFCLLVTGCDGDHSDDYDCSCEAACEVRACAAAASADCVSRCKDGDFGDIHVNCLCRYQGATQCSQANSACWAE
ncbi:MAG: hypothetical protein IT373_38460 [Polyangiaceae bacterium]|nr:hypothetical protein [Polyangiaceae bacterium]